jgi:putative redox protein
MNKTEDAVVENLGKSLGGYKERIHSINKGTLEWKRGLIFHGRTQGGEEISYDPMFQWGCSPTETLLMSVAGCLAIDVVSFLHKMRCKIVNFKIDMEGERKLTPPQYYKKIELFIFIAGENITPKKMDRAISLSQQKYCAVFHTLRPDIDVKISYVIE